jgi:VWFA-related protein
MSTTKNMPAAHLLAPGFLLVFLLGVILLSPKAFAQESAQPQKPGQPDEVVRVDTELVQTDLTIVDKRGRFVSGLTPQQFELRVDARLQPIAFFEQVATGSDDEGRQLAAARNPKLGAPRVGESTSATNSDRGRLIFFFVDDVHLAGDSLTRARSLLFHFVEDRMTPNDRVAVVSTSGQIGFLQQLTDNKAVLREAIGRLTSKHDPEIIASQVRISEVDANVIANRGNSDLFNYLVEATMKEFQMQDPLGAVMIVKNRVQQINAQSKLIELETLSRLESLIRSTAPLPGRKLVFFISDGFVMDSKRSNGIDVLRRVVDEAARVGAVVHSLDTRAVVWDGGADVSRNDYPDFGSRTVGRTFLEDKTPQEPLEKLADETGGRSYINSNTLDDGLSQALNESSNYYLLAWRPDTESQRSGKSRLDVTIQGRPDLRVRMRRHFVDFRAGHPDKSSNPKGPTAITTPEEALRAALGSLYPRRDLPTALSVGYVYTPDQGMVLNLAMQVDAQMLSFDAPDGRQESVVDVIGVAMDDRGSFSTFKQKMKITRDAAFENGRRFVQWSQALSLAPGLYQVRVAVRDSQNGRTGRAIQWIEIPRSTAGTLSMSSIFIGERKIEDAKSGQLIPVKVDHSFARRSHLRYQIYVYNAIGSAEVAGVGLEVRVLRGTQTVFKMPVNAFASVGTNLAGIPFSDEIDLGQFTPGPYVLEITATNKTTNVSVSRQAGFVIE